MKNLRSLALSACVILGSTVTLTSAANAGFVNGSFETGDTTGWTVSADGDGLNPFGTTYGSGMDGTYWAWLAGFELPRSFEQTVTGLVSGTSYAVKFIMASEFSNSDSLHVSADGGPTALFTAPPINATFWDNWVSKEFDFVASGSSAAILFDSFGLNAGGYDVGFDNVTITGAAASTAVPEPMTLTLFGAGLVGLGAMRRRRKAKV